MTNQEILEIAMRQSAIDGNCAVADFYGKENKIVLSKANPEARRYLELPLFCDLVTYGNNIVASVDEKVRVIVGEYINKYPAENCFDTPNMHVLNDALQEFGMRVCFMAEYFLPDVQCVVALPCEYQLQMMEPADFSDCYVPAWSNALCEKRRHLDVLAVGAFTEDGEMIGLAGCSADCDSMWQIGIDVMPDYRRKGIAAALTSRLTLEILARGKVPFYCAAWSNIKSVRNAIKSGFRPAWVQMTAKSVAFIDEINR